MRVLRCARVLRTIPNYNRRGVEPAGEAPERAIDRDGRNNETESELKKYMCLICGWIYDEAEGAPEEGIAPGTRWEDVPPNWTCPECGARKEDFEMIEI